MSTFLQLCQDLRREAGITGSGPSSVTSQTGELQRVVEWISAAYEHVQNLYPTWDFLRTEFSFNTINGTGSYAKAAVPLLELGQYKPDSLKVYTTSVGVGDEVELVYYPWEDFRATYMRSTTATQTGKPNIVSVKPDQSLVFWPVPNAVYTVTGEYFKRAQEMTSNTDEPLIPQQFQQIIVWRALMLYGAYSGASDVYMHGQNEYKAILKRLVQHRQPEVQLCGPLA